jgi:hypothetical protein
MMTAKRFAIFLGLVSLLLAFSSLPRIAVAQVGCDFRREMMELLLALERYSGLATEAVTTRRVGVADAYKAGNEFKVAETRLGWACGSRLKVEASVERRLFMLAMKRAHGLDMLLLGVIDTNDPSQKQSHEAALELIKLASEYFAK